MPRVQLTAAQWAAVRLAWEYDADTANGEVI